MLIPRTTFWNKMARGYARRPVADEKSYQYKLEKTAEYLRPNHRVLEFGCGTGTTALIHAPRVNWIDAIDFSSEMIAIAREKVWDQSIPNVRFEVSAFETWTPPEGNKDYDAVLGMSILHLVEDLDATLAHVVQCLKPGGLFFSSTVCLGEIKGIWRFALPPLGAIGVLPKILPLTAAQLTAQMQAQGLEIEHSWRPPRPGSVFIIARKPA